MSGNRERINTGGSMTSPHRRPHRERRPRTFSNSSVDSGISKQHAPSTTDTSYTLRERTSTIESLALIADHEGEHDLDLHGGQKHNFYLTTRRRKIVNWIERQVVPIPRRLKKTAEPVHFISGLEMVLYGTSSAADAVLLMGLKPPRYLWYMWSGSFCDVIQLGFDYMLHKFLNVQDPTICWTLSFVMSVVFRHTSHRYLVFGDYVGGYWVSLIRMYAGYSIIIVLSTVVNLCLTRLTELSHYLAWFITIFWSGIANYFILKRLWGLGGPSVNTTS